MISASTGAVDARVQLDRKAQSQGLQRLRSTVMRPRAVRGLLNVPQLDRSTELSANPLHDASGIVDGNQEPDYRESSDSEQETPTSLGRIRPLRRG